MSEDARLAKVLEKSRVPSSEKRSAADMMDELERLQAEHMEVTREHGSDERSWRRDERTHSAGEGGDERVMGHGINGWSVLRWR